ncbi:MAG: hypothetical protein M0Z69_06940 [Actinomycetota bacterium]|nr:hypothetical protein [Actinomycetota bacterium]
MSSIRKNSIVASGQPSRTKARQIARYDGRALAQGHPTVEQLRSARPPGDPKIPADHASAANRPTEDSVDELPHPTPEELAAAKPAGEPPQKKLPARDARDGTARQHKLDTLPDPEEHKIRRIVAVVQRSGVAPLIRQRLNEYVGNENNYSAVSPFLALVMVLYHMNNKPKMFYLTKAVQALTSLSDRSWWEIFCCGERPTTMPGYESFVEQSHRLVSALDQGWLVEFVDEDGVERVLLCDWEWLTVSLLEASVPEDVRRRARAIAIDDFGIRTAARVRKKREDFGPRPVSGKNADRLLSEDPMVAYQERFATGEDDVELPVIPPMPEAPARPKPGEWGRDGRRVYTMDPDARGGWMTSVNSRKGHPFVGFQSYPAILAQQYKWNGDPASAAGLQEPIPPYIVGCITTPAGSVRGEVGADLVRQVRLIAPEIRDVVADRGFTVDKARFVRPLHEIGVDVTCDYTVTEKRAGRTVALPSGDVIWMQAGTPCHLTTPKHLRNISGSPEICHCRDGEKCPSGEQKCPGHPNEVVEAANARAKTYLLSRHDRQRDGSFRLRCPLHSGKARNAQLNAASQWWGAAEPVLAPPGMEKCCEGGGLLRATAEQMVSSQRVPWGTTAWLTAYHGRIPVEGAIGDLREYLGREDRYTLRFGLGTMRLLALAACVLYNIELERLGAEPECGEDGQPKSESETSESEEFTEPLGSAVDAVIPFDDDHVPTWARVEEEVPATESPPH